MAPIWTYRPNWRASVVDRLSWRTELQASENNTESPHATRSVPRRRYEWKSLIGLDEIQRLDAKLVAHHADKWHIPIWQDVALTVFDLSAGNTAISVESIDHREFAVDGYAVLISEDREQAEAIEIGSLTSGTNGGINAKSGLTYDWPAGTTVYPSYLGHLPPTIDYGQITAGLAEASLQVELTGQPASPTSHAHSTYNDGTGALPLWEHEPNWISAVDEESERLLERVDFGIGAFKFFERDTQEYFTQTHDHQFVGRAEASSLREWLRYLAGRYRQFWVPTWHADLTATRGLNGTDNYLYVEPVDWTQYGGQLQRRDLYIHTTSGAITVGVNSTTDLGDEERLTLDATPAATALDDILMVSWLQKVRLNTDTIEFAYTTAAVGNVTTEVRTLHE